jgi:hypothetical protein
MRGRSRRRRRGPHGAGEPGGDCRIPRALQGETPAGAEGGASRRGRRNGEGGTQRAGKARDQSRRESGTEWTPLLSSVEGTTEPRERRLQVADPLQWVGRLGRRGVGSRTAAPSEWASVRSVEEARQRAFSCSERGDAHGVVHVSSVRCKFMRGALRPVTDREAGTGKTARTRLRSQGRGRSGETNVVATRGRETLKNPNTSEAATPGDRRRRTDVTRDACGGSPYRVQGRGFALGRVAGFARRRGWARPQPHRSLSPGVAPRSQNL